MTVSWTPHRFTGGILALDAANTVVLRFDPEKTFDRFDNPAEIARFADAASGFRATELGGRRLEAQSRRRRSRRSCCRSAKRPTACFATRCRKALWPPAICRSSCKPAPKAWPAAGPKSARRDSRSATRRRRSPSRRHLPSRRCRCCATTRSPGSESVPTAAGCSSTAAATPAASGAIWRSAATARRQTAHYRRRTAAREVSNV